MRVLKLPQLGWKIQLLYLRLDHEQNRRQLKIDYTSQQTSRLSHRDQRRIFETHKNKRNMSDGIRVYIREGVQVTEERHRMELM